MKTIKTAISVALAGAAFAGLAACAGPTSGVGVASTPAGDLRATMTWNSNGGRAGVMTAALSNGETYTGRYFQISHDTQVTDLEPLWVGWGPPWGGPRWHGGFGYGWRGRGWGGWGGWDSWGPQTSFITVYSGRVVANLDGPNGTHMRCTFDLRNPSYGMPGGGMGGCQLPSGQTIDATFERTSS